MTQQAQPDANPKGTAMTASTEEKPAEAAPTVRHAWMITIQWTAADGRSHTATRSGSTGIAPGSSRNAVSADIYAEVRQALGAESAVVLFFALEPDAL